jgi:YD repeat-containing protein
MTLVPRSGEPLETRFPEGRRVRYEYDPTDHLQASYETDAVGTEQLVKCWFLEPGVPFALISIAAGAHRFVPSGGDAINPCGLANTLRIPEFVTNSDPLSPSTLSGEDHGAPP